MSLKKFTRSFVVFGLLFCFVGGAELVVNAKDDRRVSDRKRCYDYDRNASSADEEKTSGDCNGTVPTPEPVSIILFTAGLAGVGFAARRRLRRPE